MAKAMYIRVNRSKIYLSEALLKKGRVVLDEEHSNSSDQCDGCGDDIIESGEKIAGINRIECKTCKTIYPVHEER